MWFKIKLAKDGAIRSCDEVSGSFENSERVICIEADNKVKAIEKARKHWKREYRKRVYHERKGLGVCVHCMDQAKPGSTMCGYHQRIYGSNASKCKDVYEKRKALGLKPGEPLPKEHDARLQPHENRNYGGQPSGLLNLRTLLVCQANLERMTGEQFKAWLQRQIDDYRERQFSRKRENMRAEAAE